MNGNFLPVTVPTEVHSKNYMTLISLTVPLNMQNPFEYMLQFWLCIDLPQEFKMSVIFQNKKLLKKEFVSPHICIICTGLRNHTQILL